MNFLAPLVAVAATTLSSPLSKIELDMIALTPKQVETKLDSIILFTPSDKDGIPLSFEFEVDGNKKNIYFAAFSPSAVNFLTTRVISQSKDKDIKYVYTPKSLSKFNSLIDLILYEFNITVWILKLQTFLNKWEFQLKILG